MTVIYVVPLSSMCNYSDPASSAPSSADHVLATKPHVHGFNSPLALKLYFLVDTLHFPPAIRELSVYLDGQRLRHECHPTYLGVTLDHTLSYREHLRKTAGKLKNRNNLLMKLAGSTWGASANTLQSSAPALCYSAAEYCAPVWSRSAHTSQVNVQLTLPCASSQVPSVLHLSHGFQCSPTLNCQPHKGRLPLTSWWRKYEV